MAAEGVGVLGGHGEPDLGPGIRTDRVAQLPRELGEVLVGEDEAEAVAVGFGEELFEAAGQVQEVLAFVDIQRAVDPGGLSQAGPVGGGLPDGGDDEAAEEAGGVVAEEAFGDPHQADPAVEDRAHVDAGASSADDLAGEVAQQEGPELVHEGACDLALGSGSEPVVEAPEPPQPDRVAGNRGDLGGTEGLVGEQAGHVGQRRGVLPASRSRPARCSQPEWCSRAGWRGPLRPAGRRVVVVLSCRYSNPAVLHEQLCKLVSAADMTDDTSSAGHPSRR